MSQKATHYYVLPSLLALCAFSLVFVVAPLHTTHLAYRYSPYPCQGLVERQFHIELGSL